MPTLFTGHMSGVELDPGMGARRCRARRTVPGRVGRARRRGRLAELVPRRRRRCGRKRLFARRGRRRARRPRRVVGLGPRERELELRRAGAPRARAKLAVEEMTSAIRAADGLAEVTIGIHMEDLEEDRRLGPHEAAGSVRLPHDARVSDLRAMGARRHRRGVRAVPGRVTRWLGGGADVLLSEFGLPTFRDGDAGVEHATGPPFALIEEAEAAEYIRRVLPGLREAGAPARCSGATRTTTRRRFEHPPLDEATHERSFGLWRVDGSAKPAVDAVRSFAGATRLPAPERRALDRHRRRAVLGTTGRRTAAVVRALPGHGLRG